MRAVHDSELTYKYTSFTSRKTEQDANAPMQSEDNCRRSKAVVRAGTASEFQ